MNTNRRKTYSPFRSTSSRKISSKPMPFRTYQTPIKQKVTNQLDPFRKNQGGSGFGSPSRGRNLRTPFGEVDFDAPSHIKILDFSKEGMKNVMSGDDNEDFVDEEFSSMEINKPIDFGDKYEISTPERDTYNRFVKEPTFAESSPFFHVFNKKLNLFQKKIVNDRNLFKEDTAVVKKPEDEKAKMMSGNDMFVDEDCDFMDDTEINIFE